MFIIQSFVLIFDLESCLEYTNNIDVIFKNVMYLYTMCFKKKTFCIKKYIEDLVHILNQVTKISKENPITAYYKL